MCRRAGVARLIVDGSFVTDRRRPGDADCLLVPGQAFRADSDAAAAIDAGLPYLSLRIVDTPEEYAYHVKYFGTDRDGIPKGLVEVML